MFHSAQEDKKRIWKYYWHNLLSQLDKYYKYVFLVGFLRLKVTLCDANEVYRLSLIKC